MLIASVLESGAWKLSVYHGPRLMILEELTVGAVATVAAIFAVLTVGAITEILAILTVGAVGTLLQSLTVGASYTVDAVLAVLVTIALGCRHCV